MRRSILVGGLAMAALILVGAGCGSVDDVSRPLPDGGVPADMAAAPEAEHQGDGEPLLGGDRDEHGCIGSAGYAWCESKEKCIRPWEEDCFTSDEAEGASSGRRSE